MNEGPALAGELAGFLLAPVASANCSRQRNSRLGWMPCGRAIADTFTSGAEASATIARPRGVPGSVGLARPACDQVSGVAERVPSPAGQHARPLGGRPSQTCSASMSPAPVARAIARR